MSNKDKYNFSVVMYSQDIDFSKALESLYERKISISIITRRCQNRLGKYNDLEFIEKIKSKDEHSKKMAVNANKRLYLKIMTLEYMVDYFGKKSDANVFVDFET